MDSLQNIDAQLFALNARLAKLYALQERSETDAEHDSYQPQIDKLYAEVLHLETYRHEARIYHNYHDGVYDGDADYFS